MEILTNAVSDLNKLKDFINMTKNKDDYKVFGNHVLMRHRQSKHTTYYRFVFTSCGMSNPYASGPINKHMWDTFNAIDNYIDLLYESGPDYKCLNFNQHCNLETVLKRLRCIESSNPVVIKIVERTPKNLVYVKVVFSNGKMSLLKVHNNGKVTTSQNQTIMLANGKIPESCPPIYKIVYFNENDKTKNKLFSKLSIN